MPCNVKKWIAMTAAAAMLFSSLAVSAMAADAPVKIDGEMVAQTTEYPGGAEIISVPTCESGLLTLTVDGQVRNLKPGVYEGHVVLSVTEDVVVEYTAGSLTHHFRQAVYGDETGIVAGKSVAAAAQDVLASVDGKNIIGGRIDVLGDEFNGIYITGGTHTVKDLTITAESYGTGNNDFAGYGAALMATGENTKMVLDNVNVSTKGVVHSALIAGGGANVVVKNSTLAASEGTLPEDYQFTTSLGFMKTVPWMLGLNGNNRATNMIGGNTKETFINSTVAAEGWGVLSVDDCSNVILTGINSNIAITGESGYGCYVIGGAQDQFYGSTIEVPDYAAILTTTGSVTFDDSTPEKVAELNETLELGLTADELAALPQQNTVLNTGRSSVMFHGMEASGDGLSANVLGGTQINSQGAIFLSRGAAAYINVDGADGVQLNTETGVITQMVDLDKAVRQYSDEGLAIYPGPWTQFYESYEDIVKNDLFDVTQQSANDVVNNFSNITLEGDLYNATTGKILDMGGRATDRGQNMVVNLDNATLTGVISASFAQREKGELYPEDYKLIGTVENIPCAAVNNGVIVSLTNGAVWNVTGDSYITSLTVADDCQINGDVTLDGKPLTVETGETYTGEILVSGNYVPEEVVEEEETSVIEDAPAPAPEEAPQEEIPEPVPEEPQQPVEEETSSDISGGAIAGVCVILVVAVAVVLLIKKKK